MSSKDLKRYDLASSSQPLPGLLGTAHGGLLADGGGVQVKPIQKTVIAIANLLLLYILLVIAWEMCKV